LTLRGIKTHLKPNPVLFLKREGFGNCGELLHKEHEIEVER